MPIRYSHLIGKRWRMPNHERNGKVLSSWKEVADFLGVTVRTAQTWERERNLPIRRAPGIRGRIFADALQLEEWRKDTLLQKGNSSPQSMAQGMPSWRRKALVITGLLVMIIAVLVGARFHFYGGTEPSSVRTEPNTLIISDEGGKELWRHFFPEGLDPLSYSGNPEGVRILDIDGDGHKEVLLRLSPGRFFQEGLPLICYDKGGRERWRFVQTQRVRSATESFPKPYSVYAFAPIHLKREGETAIVVSSLHIPWYPCQIALLSSKDGHILRQYWHSGYLTQLVIQDFDGDGQDDICLGGQNNAYDAATLVVLDPYTMDGASVEDNPKNQLLGFSAGSEKARLLFPRSCMNLKFEKRNTVSSLVTNGQDLTVAVQETSSRPVGTVYKFDHALNLINCQFDDVFPKYHAELEVSGMIDHHLSPAEEAEMKKIRRLK